MRAIPLFRVAMPTFISQLEEAAASISAGVGGYFDFLMQHFGAYATPSSAAEFLLFLIAGIVLTQMIAIGKSLTNVNAMPVDMEAEMTRLHQQIGRLSRTMTILQVESRDTAVQTPIPVKAPPLAASTTESPA